jgi:hypothetical protein
MKGITAAPVTIAAGQNDAKLILKVAPDAAPGPRPNLTLRAVAVVNGNVSLNHDAKFILLVLPAKVAILSVSPTPPFSTTVLHGSEAEIIVKLARLLDYKDAFKLEMLPDDMQGITAVPVSIAAGQNEARLVLKVAADARPGPRPNLTLRAVAVVNGKVTLNHEVKFNLLILPTKVASLAVSEPNAAAKAGSDKEISVKLARLFDYQDGFKVQLIVPDGMKGVTAGEISIAPGQSEGKLILKIAPDAQPGPRDNLTVRAIAVVNGNVILTHELKFNVTVTK